MGRRNLIDILFDRYPKPSTISSEVSSILENVRLPKSSFNVASFSIYKPQRSVESSGNISSLFNALNTRKGIQEIRPYFDPNEIAKFYDSISGDRPIIFYTATKGLFITTIEHIFNEYSKDYEVVNEDGYEVIYPDDLYTLTYGHNVDISSEYPDMLGGALNQVGFIGSLAPVKRLIRHAVNKKLLRMRATTGESVTTEDHSYILANRRAVPPSFLKDHAVGKIRRISFKLDEAFKFEYSPMFDLNIDENGTIIVLSPASIQFADFVRLMYEYGQFIEDEDKKYYLIPPCPFIVGLLGEYEYMLDGEFIKLSEDDIYFAELNYLFGDLKEIRKHFLTSQFLLVYLSSAVENNGTWVARNQLTASLLSFALAYFDFDYIIKYESDDKYHDTIYRFVDIRHTDLPYYHVLESLDDVTDKYMDDGRLYVYDLSVEHTECFVDGVGLITLHNTEVILRRAVDYYITRMPKESWTVVSDDPEVKDYVLQYFEILKGFGTDILDDFIEDCVRNLVLYANCFIRRKYSNRKYNNRKIVVGYEILPINDISILFDTNKGKIVGYKLISSNIILKPDDVIHLVINRHVGFLFGTPNLYSALNDIRTLRILEQHLEILSATYSRPHIAIKVGTPATPASRPPNDGLVLNKYGNITKSDLQEVKRDIEGNDSVGMFVIPYYHDLVGVSATPPIDLVPAIQLFKTRIYQAMGVDPVVMGETTTRNRDTAEIAEMISNRNVSYIMMKVLHMIDDEIIKKDILSLLPFRAEAHMYSDRLDMREYQQRINLGIMLWNSNLLTLDEVRKEFLGKDPLDEEGYMKTLYGLTGKIGIIPVANEAESQVAPENQHGKQLSQPRVNKK